MFEISDLRRREILHLKSVCFPPWGRGGGYIFIFIFFRKLNILGGGGSEDFGDIFGGYHKIGLYLEVISMHFRVFSEGQGTEWRIFLGLLKFQIFIWGA